MSVTWSLTRERIADKALEKCLRLGIGETTNADDRALCLEALDGLLKNLLWHGLSWPKTISSFYPVAFLAAQQSNALPTDFYTGAQLFYVNSSAQEIPLPIDTAQQWDSIPLKSNTAVYPTEAYIDNFNKLWIYPIPTASLTINLYYQQVISDSVAASAVDLDSPWYLALSYGVAAEVGDEFGVSAARIARFEAKWREGRDLGIMNERPPAPDRMTVSD